MSNLQSKLSGVKFEPVRTHTLRTPGAGVFIFGVAYPAIVIVIELASRMCAEALFDPMPTYGHVLAASLVPAGNLLVWRYLQDDTPRGTRWLAFAQRCRRSPLRASTHFCSSRFCRSRCWPSCSGSGFCRWRHSPPSYAR